MAKQTAETEEEWQWRVSECLRRTLGDEASIDDDLLDLAEKASYRITELEDGCSPKQGAEAEELRRGIEELLKSANAPDTPAEDHYHEGLRKLLDEVDARDSLAFLEEREKMEKALVRATAQLISGGSLAATHPAGQELRKVAEELADKRLIQILNDMKKKERCQPKSTSASRQNKKTRRSSI